MAQDTHSWAYKMAHSIQHSQIMLVRAHREVELKTRDYYKKRSHSERTNDSQRSTAQANRDEIGR